ncbi:MAG: thermonuclease family protein [Pseudomonadota bacterium]
MMKSGGLVVFKPSRRVFAGRGRSLLTFGEWKIALTAMVFGGAIGAGWVHQYEAPLRPLALAQPAAAPLTQTASIAAAPVAAAEIIDAAAETVTGESVLPQIVLAADDGRVSRLEEAKVLIAEAARIVDGDTLYLDGVPTRIRLWGVDAPERDEEGFDEATQTLALLVKGETLSCEHIDTDAYQRIVARCYFKDGRDLSEQMIDSGAATEFLRYTRGYYGGE